MRKPALDHLRLWHITAGAQYLFGTLLFILGTFLVDFRTSGSSELILFLFGVIVFLVLSLITAVSAVSERSIAGFLAAIAPIVCFYLLPV